MAPQILVLPGTSRMDLQILTNVAAEFGWATESMSGLGELLSTQPITNAVAILFHRNAFGSSASWLDAVKPLKLSVPDVPLVACHEFSEPFDWPALCDAGAFHAVWLPLKEGEVRRCFGFIWQARERKQLEQLEKAVASYGGVRCAI